MELPRPVTHDVDAPLTPAVLAKVLLQLGLTYVMHPDRHLWITSAEYLDHEVWEKNREWRDARDRRIAEARRGAVEDDDGDPD